MRQTDVMMLSSHSWMPSRPSVCACQTAVGRSVRVDVMVTVPDESPEYRRSLSSEKWMTLTWATCVRRIWDGDGDGGGLEDMQKEDRMRRS